MPEARDRISRAADIAAAYARRRHSIISGGNGRGESITVPTEDPVELGSTTPFRWRETPLTGARGGTGVADASGSGSGDVTGPGSSGTPRIRLGVTLQMSPGTVIGRRTISPATRRSRGRGIGRGRGRRGGVLPDWYPRSPLQDITGIVRAIERRRARMRRESEGQQAENPIPQEQTGVDPTVSTSGAQLEQGSSSCNPCPTVSSSSSVSVPKILFDITNQSEGEAAGLTPEKKLLNEIDTVEKVVTEELRKLKRTPEAKKAEREKKVKTLMSMR